MSNDIFSIHSILLYCPLYIYNIYTPSLNLISTHLGGFPQGPYNATTLTTTTSTTMFKCWQKATPYVRHKLISHSSITLKLCVYIHNVKYVFLFISMCTYFISIHSRKISMDDRKKKNKKKKAIYEWHVLELQLVYISSPSTER